MSAPLYAMLSMLLFVAIISSALVSATPAQVTSPAPPPVTSPAPPPVTLATPGSTASETAWLRPNDQVSCTCSESRRMIQQLRSENETITILLGLVFAFGALLVGLSILTYVRTELVLQNMATRQQYLQLLEALPPPQAPRHHR